MDSFLLFKEKGSGNEDRWHTVLTFLLNSYTMSGLLYIIAVILVIAWAVGFFAYSAGSIIHVLLVLAVVAVLLRIIGGSKPV